MSAHRIVRWSFVIASLAIVVSAVPAAMAGNVFVTGHDPDFHASLGGNAVGAQNLIARALDFARDGNTDPILFIQSGTDNNALGDHTDSEPGLVASGYTAGNTPGNHYVKVNATQFASENMAGYSALYVPSDHGGSLTGDDLAALNARATDLRSFVNAGGGIVALSEDGFRTPASVGPQPANYGFLPFLASAAAVSQFESGFSLTPFGLSLGLAATDVNGNFSHAIITAFGNLSVVDADANGNVVSVAGTIPESSGLVLTALGCVALIASAISRSPRCYSYCTR